jgi:predicted MFS family arabinose efflux permease
MAAPAPHLPLVTLVGIGALVAWRLYRRTRKLVMRQHFNLKRSRMSLVFFPLLLVLFLATSYTHPLAVAAEVVGVAIGVVLAVYGLRHTKYENTAEGLFYTPNAHIGIALSVLLASRVIYRFFQMYASTSAFAAPPQDFARSPLTLLIFGTTAGYYAWYALGLIRWSRLPRVDS